MTMTLLQVHFFAICFWLGLLAAETVMELHLRSGRNPGPIASIHRWIDLLFEGPAVVLVLVTGGLLLAQNWPAPPLLWVKVACGLIAIAANLYCIPLVVSRARATDESVARTLTRRISHTGWAIPFALAAFVIGIAFLRAN
jgi:hypothetical protein